MRRKIGWGITTIYNFFRLPILSIINNGKIKFNRFEIISPMARVFTDNNGTIELGEKCLIEANSVLRSTGGKIILGDKVYINRNCNVISREIINIGSGVTIGPNVCIYDHDHAFGANKAEKYKTAPVTIGENVWIGANAVILRGVSIGANSVIGAGAIITKNIPLNTIVTEKREIVMREII